MKKFLSFSMFVTSVALCVSIGYLLSTLLLASGVLQTSTVAQNSQGLYAIYLEKADNEKDLLEAKAVLQSQDGAGYILKQADTFYLLASVYDNKSDAELVKKRLANDKVESEILKIVPSTQNINGAFSQSEKEILDSCTKAPMQIYKSLFDIAVSLDTNVKDKTEAKLLCNEVYSSFITVKTNFETFLGDRKLDSVAQKLEKMEQTLSALTAEKYETQNQTFSSLVKLTYCTLLFSYFSF